MSEISLSDGTQMQQIDISNLNFQQLVHLKQQMDQELNVFQDSLHKLKLAQSRFLESGSCLEKITPKVQGQSSKFNPLIMINYSYIIPFRRMHFHRLGNFSFCSFIPNKF